MKLSTVVLSLLASPILVAAGASAAPDSFWSFDSGADHAADSTRRNDSLRGAVSFVPGVRGQALILDGQTTHLIRPAAAVPDFTNAFTVQGWVALGAYPLRQAPLIDLYDPARGGLFVGFDFRGRLQLVLRAGDREQTVTAPVATPLRVWQHIAVVYSQDEAAALYLDGTLVAHAKIDGPWAAPSGLDLLIARHRYRHRPEGTIRLHATAESFDFIDGAIDEVELHGRALSVAEIADAFARIQRPITPPLAARVLPAGPAGPGVFGAFYTRLQFHPQWDAHWRIGDHADVVVCFDRAPIRLVFWHGASYVPHWVTENGLWYNNEFTETWTGVQGCGEPMSDRQARYSHVRILESSEARAVVHWRYALGDVFHTIARTDPETGWGDWTDEIHTIYPDGTSVRDITLHSSAPAEPHEWQESIVVMSPGVSPTDALDPAALTIAGAAQGEVTYSWQNAVPPKEPSDRPSVPSIQLINTKSRFRPFTLLRPQDEPSFTLFATEIRREECIFPWWNHWPAGVVASDGRNAYASDRPSHSSLANLQWNPYREGPHWMRKIMFAGLTDRAAADLRPVLHAWSRPAKLVVSGHAFLSDGYDPAQKAYLLTARQVPPHPELTVELQASAVSPIANPAFVIRNWGDALAELWIDGRPVPRGTEFRYGHRRTLESTDLIVWIALATTYPIRLRLEAPAR